MNTPRDKPKALASVRFEKAVTDICEDLDALKQARDNFKVALTSKSSKAWSEIKLTSSEDKCCSQLLAYLNGANTVDMLMRLPMIGPKRAAKILKIKRKLLDKHLKIENLRKIMRFELVIKISKLADEKVFSSARTSIKDAKKESFEKGLSADATAYALSSVMSKAQETTSSSEVSEGPTTVKIHEATQPATSTSEFGNVQSAASAPGLSPSSSMNSLNLEKSTLNPHAKEFKFNPNAKSFVPVPTPVRSAAPVSDGSYYYYPPNVAPVSHMQMGTSFAPHQPVMYGPQTTSYQSQQPYFLSNIPQYGQQVYILVNPDR